MAGAADISAVSAGQNGFSGVAGFFHSRASGGHRVPAFDE
jgi:hypothetical protein